MDTELFVKELKLLAPSKENLKKFNVDDSFIDYFRSRFYCIPKSQDIIKNYSGDLIISLLDAYDCSKIEIGTVNFLFEPIENVAFYHIGNVDGDILVLNKISLKIEVLDYTNTDHVIWQCSSNSNGFLEALLICAEFFVLKLENFSLVENKKYMAEVINECIEKAGGFEYVGFYQMLLGYFD